MRQPGGQLGAGPWLGAALPLRQIQRKLVSMLMKTEHAIASTEAIM